MKMKALIPFLFMLIGTFQVNAQTKFEIRDYIKLYQPFNDSGSVKLDPKSNDFELAKQNVLGYCDKNLAFKVTEKNPVFSCTKYNFMNTRLREDLRNAAEKDDLKYKFLLAFQVSESITYHASFYLDSKMNVRYASEELFTMDTGKLWTIIAWNEIKEDVLTYKGGFIGQAVNVELKYSESYGAFIYVVTQKSDSATKVKPESLTSGGFVLKRLIVNAADGTVLKEVEKEFSYYGSER